MTFFRFRSAGHVLAPPGTGRASRWTRLRPALGFIAVALVALVSLDRLAVYGAERLALARVHGEGVFAADLRVAALRAEIEKQRTLPVVLAQDPDVYAALDHGDAASIQALDNKLRALATATRTGVIYLLDPHGLCISASNAGTPMSFVGSDYSFRPYFARAMAEGAAEHFAFGTVSLHPGLYLTRRVDGPDGPLGVLVVKAEFDEMENDWRRLPMPAPTFVTDSHSIVLITSEPAWRFRALGPLDAAEKAALRNSLQFGEAPLDPLPLQPGPEGAATVRTTLPGARTAQTFVETEAAVPTTGWTLHVLSPTAPALALAATATRSLALLLGVVGFGTAGLVLTRRQQLKGEKARGAAARRELEERVATRTAELQDANEQLRAEMAERRRARIALEVLQDELAQASKLAVLGQIAASIAHEVNQPLAAIRVFADNAGTFLDQHQPEAARANLTTIAALTERIGTITQELRAFARKRARDVGPVEVEAAINGALLLMGYRLRQQDITLSVRVTPPELQVRADRARLEQVFVNLLQNAAEALTGQPHGNIHISAGRVDGDARIVVADDGPGLPAEVMEALFLPFTTTKPNGLGLGLVICQDIIREFGGAITVENDHGARFTLTLPEAR